MLMKFMRIKRPGRVLSTHLCIRRSRIQVQFHFFSLSFPFAAPLAREYKCTRSGEKDVSIAHFPSSQSFSPEKSVQRFLENGTRRKDNIKTFIEGGAKLVKHRVSTRSCGMSAFIDSRRSQFSLSLSLPSESSSTWPPPPFSSLAFTLESRGIYRGNTTQGKPKMVTASALQRRSIPRSLLVPPLSIYPERG